VDEDLAEWRALLAPSYDLAAHGWRSGDGVRDLRSGLDLVVQERARVKLWQGRGATVVARTALGPIAAFLLLELAAGDRVTVAPAGGGQLVALNDASDGERVYVCTWGSAPVEVGAGAVPVGSSLTSDGAGRAVVATASDTTLGTSSTAAMVVGGVPYLVAAIAGTTVGAATPVASASGPIGTLTLSGPSGIGQGQASGAIGTLTLSGPAGSAQAEGSGAIGTLTLSGPAGTGEGEGSGAIGTLTLSGPTGTVLETMSNVVPGTVIDCNMAIGVTLLAGQVAGVFDNSDHGNASTQPTALFQPGRQTAALNGRDVCTFTQPQFLRVTSAASWQLQQFSFALVLRLDAIGATGYQTPLGYMSSFLFNDGWGQGKDNGNPLSTQLGLWVRDYLAHEVSFAANALGSWHSFILTYDGATIQGYRDGVAGVPAPLAGPIPLPAVDLFVGAAHIAANVAGYWGECSMPEWDVWDHALTGGEITSALAYFLSTYGV
jgi:hypothetical protein